MRLVKKWAQSVRTKVKWWLYDVMDTHCAHRRELVEVVTTLYASYCETECSITGTGT